MNSQNNDSYNDDKRFDEEIDRVDELKRDLTRWNDQLSYDIERNKREIDNLLSWNLLTAKEHELVVESRERLMKMERDKEEEFDDNIRNLDNSKEEYVESKNRLNNESEERDNDR